LADPPKKKSQAIHFSIYFPLTALALPSNGALKKVGFLFISIAVNGPFKNV
jgi:hypothetical protein